MFAPSPSEAPSGTALVVDSAPLLSRLYAAILSAAGYRVLSASNDREALAILTLETPDIVVLDADPTALAAPRLLEGLRSDARLSDVGVLLLTDADLGALADRANDYLCKPVDRGALVSRVRAVIESQNASKTLRSLRDVVAERGGHLRELKEHRQLQASLLPQGAMAWGAWRCVGALRAGGALGGNLFDVVVEPDGERTIFLVSAGRGVAAAKVARQVWERLHMGLPGRDLREVVAGLRASCADVQEPVRLALVRTGKAKVDVFNAGLPPLAVAERGAFKTLVVNDRPCAGLGTDLPPEVKTIPWTPGSSVTLLSEGVTAPFGASDDTPGAFGRLRASELYPCRASFLAMNLEAMFDGLPSAEDDATVVVLEGV
jgi:CheY-like chemotaxis protein